MEFGLLGRRLHRLGVLEDIPIRLLDGLHHIDSDYFGGAIVKPNNEGKVDWFQIGKRSRKHSQGLLDVLGGDDNVDILRGARLVPPTG